MQTVALPTLVWSAVYVPIPLKTVWKCAVAVLPPVQLVRVIFASDGDDDRRRKTVKLTSAGASNRLQNYSEYRNQVPHTEKRKIMVAF